MPLNPDFGGITRPHGSRRIKDQIKALCATEESQDVDTTGKLAEIVGTPEEQPIGDPPQK